MTDNFIPFDAVQCCVKDMLGKMGMGVVPETVGRVYLVRDLFGKLRMSVSDVFEEDETVRGALQHMAVTLSNVLGAHGYPSDDGPLFVNKDLLMTLDDTAQEIHSGVFLADRLMTGRGWWTVRDLDDDTMVKRITLYSIKGGVGRSTTAVLLAWHLARKGERVLVVDMDLESPCLSSTMLELERQPQFGVTDWFVEDLVGQGRHVIEDMYAAPAWAQDFEGHVRVVPAHGRNPGEYLAKLGRVYMDASGKSWTERLECLLDDLEKAFRPTVVLLESRNGLHDIAAAIVTDLNAEVLLFATNAESTWVDYDILFRHWNKQGLADRVRERLSVVSALTPVSDRDAYLQRFRSRAWDLFRDRLYDEMGVGEDTDNKFSFDLTDENAPHTPMEIGWTLELASGASLRYPNEETVKEAYGRFLNSFEERVYTSGDGKTS